MKHYRAICFDFDYTLGDSTDSIVAGFQYAFERLGRPIPDWDTVRGTVGYLLEDAYQMLTSDSDKEHRAQFRAYFFRGGQASPEGRDHPVPRHSRAAAGAPRARVPSGHCEHQDGGDHRPHHG